MYDFQLAERPFARPKPYRLGLRQCVLGKVKMYKSVFPLSFLALCLQPFATENCAAIGKNFVYAGLNNAHSTAGAAPLVRTPGATATVNCAGDGVRDDFACLNNAINGSAGAATIVFPPNKNYYISQGIGISSNKTLIGNVNTRIFTAGSSNYVFNIQNPGVTINGLWLDYRGTPGWWGPIHIGSNASHVIISNNKFTATGSIAAGIFIEGTNVSNIAITNNNINNIGGYGILANETYFGPDPTQYISGLTITNNTITGVAADAIEINSPVQNGSHTPGVAISNVTISGNTLSAPNSGSLSAGFCIGMAGVSTGIIANNNMTNCSLQGIHIEDYAQNIDIISNTISNTLRYDAISVLTYANHVNIYNNKINNSAGNGILINWDGTFFENYVNVSGNNISKSALYGILAGSNSDQDMYSIIGPNGGYGGNITSNSKGSSCGAGNNCGIYVFPGTLGVTVKGNSGN